MKAGPIRALRGPNPASLTPIVQADLDVSATPRISERALLDALPSSAAEPCGPSCALGAAPDAAVDPAHAVLHAARALLPPPARATGPAHVIERGDGARRIILGYEEESSAILAIELAIEIADAIARGRPAPFDEHAGDVAREWRDRAPGPSTKSILDEARARGIPFLKLDECHYQLGHGALQQRIQATLTSRTSAIAVETADDKVRTKDILRDAGVPVPRGGCVSTFSEAARVAERIGYPVVVKPREGNHGRGVTVGVADERELESAFERAASVDPSVIVEEVLQGSDFRILVIDHTFVAAARRDPAHVVGDGSRSVRALVALANADPERGDGHEASLTRIELDDDTDQELAKQGLTLDDVPESGRVVRLKSTANLSTGGTATDVTDEVHPSVRELAERASRVVGLDVCGIDVVAADLASPLEGRRGGICEVNAAPGFRMHLHPSRGQRRNVAAPLLDSLFPNGATGRIPIVAVTGTNGKTTTTRLIAHLLAHGGGRVGLACTDGVEVRGRRILSGDYSGPGGAAAVLKDATVTHAVLEVARGGILRRGLGFDACDVGILLNVDDDHVGTDGVETVDEMARVKATVIAAVRPGGVAVLNAEDPRSLAAAPLCRGRVVLFALDPDHPVVRAHVAEGGEAVVLRERTISRLVATGATPIASVDDVPLTMRGKAECNVRNALAATAAGLGLGMSVGEIAAALARFHPTPAQLPGRLNLIEKGGVNILVDYGHNPPALRAIASTLAAYDGGRRIVSSSLPGNRRDEDLRAFGEWLAKLYDEVYVSDADPRGRPPGETPALIVEGIRRTGKPVLVAVLEDEVATIREALARASPGDLVVLQAEDVPLAIRMAERWEPPRDRDASPATASILHVPA